MSEEVRKTVRFTKEEVDYIMNNIDLVVGYHYNAARSSFSERLRHMIKRYKWQEERITELVRRNRELSDKHADVSDKSDIKLSDDGYPKEVES